METEEGKRVGCERGLKESDKSAVCVRDERERVRERESGMRVREG